MSTEDYTGSTKAGERLIRAESACLAVHQLLRGRLTVGIENSVKMARTAMAELRRRWVAGERVASSDQNRVLSLFVRASMKMQRDHGPPPPFDSRRLVSSTEAKQIAANVLHGKGAAESVPPDIWRTICREFLKQSDLAHHRGQRISKLEAKLQNTRKAAQRLGCPKGERPEVWMVGEIKRLRGYKE